MQNTWEKIVFNLNSMIPQSVRLVDPNSQPLTATSLQWVGWECWQRILFCFVNWSRNKLISKSIDYSFIFYTTSQLDHPKTIKSCSPGAPRWSRLMSHLLPVKPACFWLVVAFLFVFGGRLRPCNIFVPDFSVAQFVTTWRGCCLRLCSRHQPPCRPTAVAAVAACWRWRQQWCWQRGNKVNKDNNNNMTTTQQPTR